MAHESVKHQYCLPDYPRTSRLRAKLTMALGREAWSIKTLMSHPEALKPLVLFIASTGRFGERFETMILPEPAKKSGKRKGKKHWSKGAPESRSTQSVQGTKAGNAERGTVGAAHGILWGKNEKPGGERLYSRETLSRGV